MDASIVRLTHCSCVIVTMIPPIYDTIINTTLMQYPSTSKAFTSCTLGASVDLELSCLETLLSLEVKGSSEGILYDEIYPLLRMYISVFNITYKDKRTNISVRERERTKVIDIIRHVGNTKWSWKEHIKRLRGITNHM